MPGSGRRKPLKQQRAIETRNAIILGAAAVFSRVPYAEARLKDLASESGISEGALYFHFASKRDIAFEVVAVQQERMHGALTEVLSRGGNALDKMLSAYAALADLVASDVVVQGGIYLQNQPGTELADATNEPYLEWVRLARILVLEGVEDGSVRPDVDADGAAEFLNALFIGAQVLSNHADSWASMPVRMRSFEPLVRIALAPASS